MARARLRAATEALSDAVSPAVQRVARGGGARRGDVRLEQRHDERDGRLLGADGAAGGGQRRAAWRLGVVDVYEVAVEYALRARVGGGSRLKPLWSASATLAASGDDGDDGVASAALSVYRLRPNTEYAFRVWLSVDGANATLAGSVSRTTPRTGHPRFDDAALATITGGVPSWELLTMAYDMETVGQAAQDFVGVVGVDQAGWVVWYYTANSETAAGGHMGIPAVWDFLPASKDYAMVLLQTDMHGAPRARRSRRPTASAGRRTRRSRRCASTARSSTSTCRRARARR